MARKNKSAKIDFDELLAEENIIVKDVIGEMEDASLNYAVKTIVDRALPDARDGLKPVQRRILYAMGEMGLLPSHSYVKSAKISGEVMGNYHPHGDSYGAMANMVHELGIRYPMVDGQGNYGHPLDGDSPASSRYTEARLDKKGVAMLKDVKKRVVDFKANYSEDDEEPEVLPAAFPFLLANGATGIATGYTTEIPSHNVSEIMDGAIAMLNNPEITTMELLKYVKGPDLPTGGYLIKSDDIIKLYETGRASLKFRAKMHVEVKDDGNQQIVITELPPDVRKADIDKKPGLVTKLHELCVVDKKISRVLSVRDESTGKKDKKTGKIENPVRIVIELHKTAVPEVIMAELYKQSSLEKTKGYIMRAISNQAPILLTLRDSISIYVEHRKDVVQRRILFDLNKAEARLHLLDGFKKILVNIDQVVKIVRNSVDPESDLISAFSLSKIQAKAVLDMPLRRLSKLEENKIDEDIALITSEIDGYKAIIATPESFKQHLLEEFKQTKKEFGDKRKTEVISESDVMNASNVSDEPMVAILTSRNNIKQIPQSAFNDMLKAGALRERKDVFVQGINCTTTDQFTIILATGEYVNVSFTDLLGMLDFLEEKQIVGLVSHNSEENSNKHIITMTKKGMIKKTEMKSFRARARRLAPYIELADSDDSIVGIRVSDGSEDNTIVVATEKGIVHRFYEKGFSSSNPGGKGVPGISNSVIAEGDNVVDFSIVKEGKDNETSVILYIEEDGEYFMKSMPLDEFKAKGRVSKGIVGAGTDLNGKVYKLKVTNEDFIVIDKQGLVHKQLFISIPIQNRYNKPTPIEIVPFVTNFFIE